MHTHTHTHSWSTVPTTEDHANLMWTHRNPSSYLEHSANNRRPCKPCVNPQESQLLPGAQRQQQKTMQISCGHTGIPTLTWSTVPTTEDHANPVSTHRNPSSYLGAQRQQQKTMQTLCQHTGIPAFTWSTVPTTEDHANPVSTHRNPSSYLEHSANSRRPCKPCVDTQESQLLLGSTVPTTEDHTTPLWTHRDGPWTPSN